ncbi:MAG: substrate-binding protein, partial [Rhodospirillales bacterium]|nr:substrate-binding protein [Rhodospirillales bacterium]
MTETTTQTSFAVSRRGLMQGAAAGAVATLAAPSIVKAAGEQPIKVGLISPLTGAWTVYGKAHSAGFELAVDEINAAGGVLGRKIEILIGDSKTEPRIVVEQANRLVREEHVDFLAGTFSSAERNAAGPVVTAARKVLLYPTFYEGQEQKYYPGVCNRDIFMFGPEPTQQVWPHMEYMVKKFGGKFFMIGSDYVWPRVTNEFTKEKLKQLGGSVVGELYIPFNTPQYDSALRQIRDSKANVIFHTLTGSDTVNFRKQFVAAGMNKDFTLWTVDDEEVVTSGLGPEVSAGAYVSFDYFMSIKNPNNAAFLQRFRAKFGKDALMNTVGVAMYNAAHMAAMALTKAGKVSTDALREGLHDLTFTKAPQGTVTMRARDNQMILP